MPATCFVCSRPAAASGWCTRCLDGLRPAPALGVPPGLDALGALVSYEGTGAALVAALKFTNRRGALGRLAAATAAVAPWAPGQIVTWAPTSAERRRRRGYDQAELLARALARQLGLPCRALLTRVGGPGQTGRSAAERRSGPALRCHRAPAQVLVVDDVLTTGATLGEAARALRAAGATSVAAVVLARTPLKVAPPRTDNVSDRFGRVGRGNRMQPTEVQVQRSLEALRVTSAGATPAGPAAPSDVDLPDGLIEQLQAEPAVREDRLAEARRRLETGEVPSDAELAQRMVGRIVCDRLR